MGMYRLENNKSHHESMQELNAREQDCCGEKCNEHGDCWHECDTSCHHDIWEGRLNLDQTRCDQNGEDCHWLEEQRNNLQHERAMHERRQDIDNRECCHERCEHDHCWEECDTTCHHQQWEDHINLNQENCDHYQWDDCSWINEERERLDRERSNHSRREEINQRSEECCYEKCEHDHCWHHCDASCHHDTWQEHINMNYEDCQYHGHDCSHVDREHFS